jgi:hypothetical protein
MFRNLLALCLIALGCTSDDSPRVARGRGLEVAQLSAVDQAQIYRAAAAAAFDLGPDLVLLLHPRLLPRAAGAAGGDSVSTAVVRAMRQAGTIGGLCEPGRTPRGDLPSCDAPVAGYIVRYSDVLRIADDTVQVYLSAEQYTVTGAPPQQVLEFEKAFQVARQRGRWRAVREGRVPQAVTGGQR